MTYTGRTIRGDAIGDHIGSGGSVVIALSIATTNHVRLLASQYAYFAIHATITQCIHPHRLSKFYPM